MKKVLFLYDDLNNMSSISSTMGVVERYALTLGKGVFKVSTGATPIVSFKDDSYIVVKPMTRGLRDLDEFDKIYVEDSIDVSINTQNFNKNVELYNESSFRDAK